jgi:asparagine synthase (glutamine-hydrolysing)
MSYLAGVVKFDGCSVDDETGDRIVRVAGGSPRTQVRISRAEGAMFVQRPSRVVHGGNDEQRLTGLRNGRTLVAAQARLDNRAELAEALGLAPPELAATSDPDLVMRMFEQRGEAGLARCLGAFAFAQWDAETRRLTLARDYTGDCALFFYRAGATLIFADTLRLLLALPTVPREIDEITLANFMVVNFINARRTLYRGIERVPSRTLITIDQMTVRHRHYWSPDFDAPPPYQREADYIERARELFDQAVATASAGNRNIAMSASGGLDSSAIAATAARLGQAERIICYTLVPPRGTPSEIRSHEYGDETDKMRALSAMYPALELNLLAPEGLHPIDEDDTRQFVERNLPSHGPTNLSWFSFLYDAVAAAKHPLLLVGVRGNMGLTWTGAFSLRSLLRAGDWRGLARELPAVARESGRGIGVARTFAAEVLIGGASSPLRRAFHRARGRDPDSVARYSALNPHFIADCRLARQWETEGFNPWFGANGWNPARYRAHHLFDHYQIARDMRAESEELHGFRLRDPHADRRLLEFALSVPEPLYRRDGVPRSFARAVFADRLPREILDERKRGAQGGAWFRRLDARRQDIAADVERMEASPLARRLIDLPRLKRLLEEWPAGEHAAQERAQEYRLVLTRAVHIGRFIRWVEGGNA